MSVASSKLSASEAANNDRLLESLNEVRPVLLSVRICVCM